MQFNKQSRRDIRAVSFDFYNTLVHHRQGQGRGAVLMQYLRRQGLQSHGWEHQVLYDIFERHAADYSPDLSLRSRQQYLQNLAERVFRRLKVQASAGSSADHAENLWAILGPASLAVFPEVHPVLRSVKKTGYATAIISNWQAGLGHFCSELGLGELVDHVLVSAEVGWEKPERAIFDQAADCLKVPARNILHVGDSQVDDCQGARRAGFRALLLRRDLPTANPDESTIASLEELISILDLPRAPDLT